jgi:hypothetical protein
MLTTELLARTVHADRERAMRERHRHEAQTASGPRHPRRTEPVPVGSTAREGRRPGMAGNVGRPAPA